MFFKGKVVKGKAVGRVLGFPTANILLYKKVPIGIYISKVKFKNLTYPALSYIGNEEILETYILDFNLNLYEKEIEVNLLKKIREVQKFDKDEDLIKAMKKDLKEARNFFK